MPKTNKTKHHARRATCAAKTALKHFASLELAGSFRSAASVDFPGVNLTALRFCALALTSK